MMTIFGNFFEKMSIFRQSNGNFPEGQVTSIAQDPVAMTPENEALITENGAIILENNTIIHKNDTKLPKHYDNMSKT